MTKLRLFNVDELSIKEIPFGDEVPDHVALSYNQGGVETEHASEEYQLLDEEPDAPERHEPDALGRCQVGSRPEY
jgi:hypothetical protein